MALPPNKPITACHKMYFTEVVLACALHCRWHYKGVTYVTINMVGSCNNLCKEYPDRREYTVRQTANLK